MTSSAPSLAKSKIRILLLEGIHASALDAFATAGYTSVELRRGALRGAELAAALEGVHILGLRSASKLTAEALRSAAKLIAVGCFCIGTNQVDLAAAALAGVPVFNAPFSNTRSVAELVLAEAVLLLRGIPRRNALAHRGGWAKTAAGSHEARGKVLGIVGYGHIGTQVGVLGEALGMQVIYYDIEAKLALGNARPVGALTDLLRQADVVTLHVPETAETRGMIGAAEFAAMKPGAHFINASRGSVADLDALAAALQAGRLAGAAIDVFPREPGAVNDEFVSPLRGLDQVLLTPHIGGSTEEAQQSIGVEVAGKLIRYSDNGSTVSAVNFPEVSLPAHPGRHRLLHIHHNRPGVLSAVNAVFSYAQVNIAGQFLETTPAVGYVVTDIEHGDPARARSLQRRLAQIPHTLRSRVLY
jgi:D-3-phosphoglycerate dehydrogenase